MASIEPYAFREKTNLQEHNDIINKVNEIVDVINDTDLDNIGTRLTNDESQIAVNTAGIKANTTAIDGLIDSVDSIDKALDTIEPMVSNHETDIANLKESERRLSNDVVSTYTLYRNGEGKVKIQAETVGGTLIDSNTLDMVIPYQYDIISGTTERSFKLNITMSDGSSYSTNDFIIPEGGGSEIVVTGITLSKDSSNVNRFHVGINLSDSTMIDSGYITMVDNVVATFVDSKLTISVNGVSSVPVAIDVSGEFTAGTGIVIESGTISIDDTVVALKSDIADMETKTNASATYATKTALALTDSVANDANEKANSAIDNVSISGSTMTFSKINDEHIDINIPTDSFSIYNELQRFTVKVVSVTASSAQTNVVGIKVTGLHSVERDWPFGLTAVCNYSADRAQTIAFWAPKIGSVKFFSTAYLLSITLDTTEIDNTVHYFLQNMGLSDGNYNVFIKPSELAINDGAYVFIKYEVSDGNVTLIETSSTKTVTGYYAAKTFSPSSIGIYISHIVKYG